jgi:hypothetical protein
MTPALARLCLEPELWRGWWVDNLPRFDPRQRYRGGQVMQPDACLVELERQVDTPRWTRELAATEFAIRSGVASSFAPDAPALRQRRLLARWRAAVFGMA